MELRVDQYHPWASPYDAITNQMFLLRDCLRDLGVESNIFAHKFDQTLQKDVLPFNGTQRDGLLIHHSQGNPWLEELRGAASHGVLVYHNITPPEFFPHDGYAQKLSRWGRAQLTDLRSLVRFAVADSEFNAHELEELGYASPFQLPLLQVSSDRKTRTSSDFPHLVFVGRIAPHKNQALLIRTLSHLLSEGCPNAQLTLIGSGDPFYRRYLNRLVESLGLAKHVRFLERIPEKNKDEILASADLFISGSQHEGFCVPLVEAMQADLPILAYAQPAVMETLGGAGVGFKTQDPYEIALYAKTLLERSDLRDEIRESQHQRLAELAQEQSQDKALTVLKLILTQMETNETENARPTQ